MKSQSPLKCLFRGIYAVAFAASVTLAHTQQNCPFDGAACHNLIHKDAEGSIASVFSADAKSLVTIESSALSLWNLADRRLLQSVRGPCIIDSVAISPNGSRIALATIGEVQIYSSFPTSRLRAIAFSCRSRAIAFSSDNRTLVVEAEPNLLFFDTETGEKTGECRSSRPNVRALAFSKDGRHVYIASAEGLDMMNLSSRLAAATYQPPKSRTIHTVCMSSDGKDLLIGCQRYGAFSDLSKAPIPDCLAPAFTSRTILGGEIVFLDSKKLIARNSVNCHSEAVNGLCYSANGRLIASLGRDGTVGIWQATDHKLLAFLPHDKTTAEHVTFSRDGEWLAACLRDKGIAVWSTHRLCGTGGMLRR